jgi:hypothetical protein
MNGNIKILIYLIVFVSLIILLYNLYYNYNEGFKYKIKLGKNNCKKNNCPIPSTQNDIFKLHIEFKPLRDKNHMLAHNSLGVNNNINTKGPANIFIIRHGEKIKSRTALDCNGILRSTYIPSLIEQINGMGFGVHYIVTAYDYASMHQQQTVFLTSWLLSIPLFMYGEQSQSLIALNEIYTNPKYNGKTILICWEHNCIQTLLTNLFKVGPSTKGINNYKFTNPDGNSKLPYWETNDFKTVMYFDNQFNFKIFKEKFTTCAPQDNGSVVFNGKKQICK